MIQEIAHHAESTTTPSILIAEDERIVAKDIRRILESLGYPIAGIASSGEDALHKAKQCGPGLILMDIRLDGAIDGIEAAGAISEHLDIPIIYLTACSDPETLKRANATRPFGYIPKPFRDTDLRRGIEIAVHKHRMESLLTEREELLATTRRSIGDAVVATDAAKRVTFLNPIASV